MEYYTKKLVCFGNWPFQSIVVADVSSVTCPFRHKSNNRIGLSASVTYKTDPLNQDVVITISGEKIYLNQ
jgi:hypothetical protein